MDLHLYYPEVLLLSHFPSDRAQFYMILLVNSLLKYVSNLDPSCNSTFVYQKPGGRRETTVEENQKKEDAFYDRGSTFPLIVFPNDGVS